MNTLDTLLANQKVIANFLVVEFELEDTCIANKTSFNSKRMWELQGELKRIKNEISAEIKRFYYE